MLKGLILGILFLGISSTAYAQNVEIVKDLRPGPLTGFLQSFSSYNGELFFTGTDEGPAFNEVFSVNEDLTITKRLSANTIRGASIIESTEDYLYIYNREGTQDRELYRSTGSNNSLNLIVEFDNDINQSTSLSNGVVFIEEDQERNKKVHYISDDASSSAVIIEEINLGQYDLSDDYIVLKPLEEDIILTISRDDLSTNVLGERVFSFVDLLDENGRLYFVKMVGASFMLIESNGDGSEVSEISNDGIISIQDGIIINNQVHFLNVANGTKISRLNSDATIDKLITFDSGNNSYDRFIEKVGDKIIFPNFESGTGLELYALSYSGVSVEDQHLVDINIYPNPSLDGQIYFEERVGNFTITDTQGKVILSGSDTDHLQLNQSGIYSITGRLKDGSLFTKRVVVK